MARSRNLRLWTLALWGVCLLAATTAHLAGPRAPAGPESPPAAVGLLSQTADAAVLPARIADDVRAAGQAAPLRVFLLAAVVAVLVGLPAVLRRRSSFGGHDSQPLRARRHTIALRAPPLQFA
ncbi:MAG TPA: hypothetical protein VFK43_20665 [Acidimicrobiales bacterium]|nr:hypothetical protein [Acidimicrobiales bacterium]